MRWIKVTKDHILILTTIWVCYGLLIIGDWLIARTLSQSTSLPQTYHDVREIEQKRVISEDMPQKAQAIREGYVPALYPYLLDSLDLEYPLIAGQPFTDTYFCNEGYGLIKYHSDRFGFRNQDKLWDLVPSHIMIGDSFVHGACVSDQKTLPSQLSAQIKDTVLNLGFGANHPSHYFAYAHLFIPLLKPKTVYLIFYPNDNGVFNQSAIEKKYIIEKQKLFAKTELALIDPQRFQEMAKIALSVLSPPTNKHNTRPKKTLVTRLYQSLARHAFLPNLLKLILPQASDFQRTAHTLRETHDLCMIHGCKMIVGFIPNHIDAQPDHRAEHYGYQIKALTQELGVSFIDGREILDRQQGSVDYAIKGHHLSPLGYQKMAIQLAQAYSKLATEFVRIP